VSHPGKFNLSHPGKFNLSRPGYFNLSRPGYFNLSRHGKYFSHLGENAREFIGHEFDSRLYIS
jgi:hypothetical protein